MNRENYISVREAEKTSGLGREWLRVLIRDGRLKAEKFGASWMIEKQSLDEYLKEHQKNAQTN